MEFLPQEIFIESFAVNVEFLNDRTGEITAGAYLLSITETVSGCQQIDTRALLIINNYILGFLWRNQWFLLFGTHTKVEIGRMSATSAAVLLIYCSDCKII